MTFVHQDLRLALRLLLRNRGFTVVVALTLAIGIAVNTAVFTWIKDVLLWPLPGVRDSARLALFECTNSERDFIPVSYPDYIDYRDHLNQTAGLAVSRPDAFSLGQDDSAQRVWGELVSGNYFDVLGVSPLTGRVFSKDEAGDQVGAYPVVVIGESVWERMFHRDPSLMGRTIRVNRQPLTVIGVVPKQFRGAMNGLRFEMWIPAVMAVRLNVMPESILLGRGSRMFFGIARLRPGLTVEAASAEAQAVADSIARIYPDRNRGIGAAVLALADGHFGAQQILGRPLRILMAVCALVLLIVCANVANLQLARAVERHREFALRMAIGAGRSQILRQLITESIVAAGLATVIAIPLSLWLSQSLAGLAPPTTLPVSLDTRADASVLAFTLLLCLAAAVLSGIAPALSTARTDVNTGLQEGGRSGSAGRGTNRLRGALVVFEVALASLALIGAGLFARSFAAARRIDPGFDPRGVAVAQLALSSAGYSVDERIAFCARLRERLQVRPATMVACADYVPLGIADGPWEPLQVEGYVPAPAENMNVWRTVTSPGYFDVLRIPIVSGRDFNERDDRQSAQVGVVNETFARRFFRGADPVGRKFRGWGRWFTIVGLVRDTKYHLPNERQRALLYVPFRQVYRADMAMAVLVRTSGDPGTVIPEIRREVSAMDPAAGVYDATSLTEFITASYFAQKMAASLIGALGFIALLLAAVGLYSVVAYAVARRTPEIGIRMALGAGPREVLLEVLGSAFVLVGSGLLLGGLAALVFSRLVADLLIGIGASDPLAFLAAPAFLAAVGLLAAAIPGMRAARIDPITALRSR